MKYEDEIVYHFFETSITNKIISKGVIFILPNHVRFIFKSNDCMIITIKVTNGDHYA